jgi:predicted ATPase
LTIRERDNFYIISGCSGGGKSAIIRELRTRGFACVDEAGRQIVQEQLRIGGDGLPWQDHIKFQELLLARYVQSFERVAERAQPVFFDRGIPEAVAWSRFLKIPVPAHHRAAVECYQYARSVLVTPPWPEIFETDAERRHSYDDAVAEYPLTLDAYREAGYRLIEVPKAPVRERADFILRHLRVP